MLSNCIGGAGGIYTAPNPPRSYLACRSRASGATLAKPPSETTKMGRRGCFDLFVKAQGIKIPVLEVRASGGYVAKM